MALPPLAHQRPSFVLIVCVDIPGGQDTCDSRTAVPVHPVVEPQRRPPATRAAAPAAAPFRRRRPRGHAHPGVAAGGRLAPPPPGAATPAAGVHVLPEVTGSPAASSDQQQVMKERGTAWFEMILNLDLSSIASVVAGAPGRRATAGRARRLPAPPTASSLVPSTWSIRQWH